MKKLEKELKDEKKMRLELQKQLDLIKVWLTLLLISFIV